MTQRKITRLSQTDLLALKQLANEIWPPAFSDILSDAQIIYMMDMMYSTATLEREMERGVEYYLLEYNDTRAGYTAIEKKDSEIYKLHKIYLLPTMQGKGLGKYQLQSMEKIVSGYGARFLLLNVNRQNKAVGFYKSQGYEIIREEDIDIGNGFFMNDYVMRKALL